MSLEQALEANTAAMIALTAALQAGGAATKPGTPAAVATPTPTETPKKGPGRPASTKPAAAPAAPAITREQMVAAGTELNDKAGKEVVREIYGPYVPEKGKMSAVPDDKVGIVFKAFTAKLAEIVAAEEAAIDNDDEVSDDDGGL